MSRRELHILALVFPIGATLAAWLLTLFQPFGFLDMFSGGREFWYQCVLGFLFGLATAALANSIEFNAAWFRRLQDMVRQVFLRMRPTRLDLFWVSIGAGWGEEVLFRGAIQPLLGIWITAALFALGHGLLTKITWGRVAYTAVLFLAGAALGYLAEWAGLWAAIVAHAVYDFVVLLWAHKMFLGKTGA